MTRAFLTAMKINEDCGVAEMIIFNPKSKRKGIMVSHFVSEKDSYLKLTDQEFQEARKINATICKEASMCLEYGGLHGRLLDSTQVSQANGNCNNSC